MRTVSEFEEYRRLLPAAERYTYLNSAGCGPLPKPVMEGMDRVFRYMYEEGQIKVQVHDDLFEYLEQARRDVAAFIGASPEEIFFVRCIAEGLNTVDYMLDLGPGDEVLVSDQENPASLLPFFAAEKIRGFYTDKFCATGGYEDIIGQFAAALGEKTKLAVFSHVLHAVGTCMPVKELCAAARKKGVLTALDGAQAAGNTIIDVKDIGCDFYIFSCHKWLCGPEGIAAVYIRKELIPKVRVPFGGVGMQKEFDIDTNTISLRDDARRFEYGGKHIPMYTAFSTTIALAEEIGMEHIVERQRQLNDYCRKTLKERLPQAMILSPEDDRLKCGIFAFSLPGTDHRKLVRDAFAQQGIIIQYRTVDLRSKKEGIRVSNNWFVREAEIDKLVDFLCGYLSKKGE
ncbi:aminotransferase class V-fold PLP-dependent enzyme [Clostridium sp. AN503]|uniref:aminotransferase class V-fold PLP-dependent enzyme n=1 Tax=Clostridium sp. AN503 TaxID=3160598 RepID=UPI00345AB80C